MKSPQYTRERLASAAAESSSMVDLMRRLGATLGSGVRSYLNRDELVAAVEASFSFAGILKLLGRADNGAGRALVKRSIEAHSISTEHFTGQGHFLGSSSPYRKPAGEILRRLDPPSPRTRTAHLRRALDDLNVPHECAACGIGDVWRGRCLVLEIDHINGDRLDNRRENLRYLCPSCHSQTDTFANRSRSSPKKQ